MSKSFRQSLAEQLKNPEFKKEWDATEPERNIENHKSNKFNDFLIEQLQDTEFRAEYEALQAEHAIIHAAIDVGDTVGLNHKENSEPDSLPG